MNERPDSSQSVGAERLIIHLRLFLPRLFISPHSRRLLPLVGANGGEWWKEGSTEGPTAARDPRGCLSLPLSLERGRESYSKRPRSRLFPTLLNIHPPLLKISPLLLEKSRSKLENLDELSSVPVNSRQWESEKLWQQLNFPLLWVWCNNKFVE